MQTTDHDKLAYLLREHMEELLFEIVELQDYLGKKRSMEDEPIYPLGVMGRVLSTELQNETLDMLEQTEQVLCAHSTDSWEKNRASVYLVQNMHTLATIMRILGQLPAGSQMIHQKVESMINRAGERYQDIETTLAAIAKQNVAIA